ncbi:MAG: hypothetical protein ACLP2F_08335 [Steroidobacteraceae bacterium]
MQRFDPIDANVSFDSALKRFEALPPSEQLPILAFMLSYAGGGIGFAEIPRRTGDERSTAAVDDKPLTDSVDSKVVVTQPQPKSEERGVNDLRNLAAAANMQLAEYNALGQHGDNQSYSRAKVQKARSVRAANQPPRSFQNLSIAIMILVSFLLTLGVMLWRQRKSAEPPLPNPATLPMMHGASQTKLIIARHSQATFGIDGGVALRS